LNELAGAGPEISVGIQLEIAGAGIQRVTCLVAQQKESVPLDSGVKRASGKLDGSLGKLTLTEGGRDTAADLDGAAAGGLRQQVVERRSAVLITGGVEVGEVVANDVQRRCVRGESAECD